MLNLGKFWCHKLNKKVPPLQLNCRGLMITQVAKVRYYKYIVTFLLHCLFHIQPLDFFTLFKLSRSDMSFGDESKQSRRPLLVANYDGLLLHSLIMWSKVFISHGNRTQATCYHVLSKQGREGSCKCDMITEKIVL